MADVFLSYAREDRARAEQVAQGLERAGLDVFWDNEIPPGTTWADYIEQKLAQCKALIVLWSQHSTTSQWVREEARMGRDKGVLIPVMIDNAQPPFGFGEVQSADLSTWNGEPDHANWRRFVDAVSRFAQNAPAPFAASQSRPAPPVPPRPAAPQPLASANATTGKKGVPVWAWAAGGVVAVLIVLGVIGSMASQSPQQPLVTSSGTPTAPGVIADAQPVQTQPAVNYQQQIMDRLAHVEQALSSQGYYRLAEPVSGQLGQGANANLPLTLEAGGDYRLVGVCDNDCADLDLFLYDQNNNLISQDNLTDAMPVVAVAPQWSGPFTAQAVMHACSVQPCYYALVLYGRSTQ